MLKRRLVAILAGLALIVAGAMKPMPARAQSAAEDLGIAFAALGAWVLAITVGTSIVYGPPWSSLDEEKKPDMNDPESPARIRFGTRCHPVPGSPQPLACW
jgi:hypothetical protein